MGSVTSCRPEDIRNIVLLGSESSGKTTLVEAMLHRCGAISRMGSVEAATTASDHEPEAKAHHHSTNSTLLFAKYEGREINIIDTPGHPEFSGYALAALQAVETAVLVVSASTGVDHNARRLFHAAGEAGLARMIVVNKIDLNPMGLKGLVEEIKREFGRRVHCLNLPAFGGRDVVDCFDHESGAVDLFRVQDVHSEILESAVEIDDAKLEKYLAGEPIALGELREVFVRAMALGRVVPVLFASARQEVGVDDLLHVLAQEAPSPLNGRSRRLVKNGELVEVPCEQEAPFLAQVFKVTPDQHLGAVAMLRVLQGRLDANTTFVVGADRRVRKAGHVLKVEGRDHPELDAVAFAGDVVALAKQEDVHVDQVLHAPECTDVWEVARPAYPAPMTSLAIDSRSRSDDVKLGQSLQRLCEEDPTFHFSQDPVTHELVASGLGEVHLQVLLERLKNRFHVDVTTKAPAVAYRETVSQKAEGHHRLKKQSGGSGQFAEVFLRVEPLERGEGFEFQSEVFGGTIPTHFIPAVEKGVRDALEAGPLAGYPVHDVRVVVYDGKAHAVDSKEIAFRSAAKLATRDALGNARPVLLEPLVALQVTAPEASIGAVTADLTQSRARVLGIETQAGMNVVRAHAPLAELQDFGARLRGATGGEGSFVMEPSAWELMPAALQQKVVDERPARKAETE